MKRRNQTQAIYQRQNVFFLRSQKILHLNRLSQENRIDSIENELGRRSHAQST